MGPNPDHLNLNFCECVSGTDYIFKAQQVILMRKMETLWMKTNQETQKHYLWDRV